MERPRSAGPSENLRLVNEWGQRTMVSRVHRADQHRSAIPGVEARTLASDRAFPRHSHDQLGIGVMFSGAHRSWRSDGHGEAQASDSIIVNPGQMHGGMPVRGGGDRVGRLLYFA